MQEQEEVVDRVGEFTTKCKNRQQRQHRHDTSNNIHDHKKPATNQTTKLLKKKKIHPNIDKKKKRSTSTYLNAGE